MLTHYSSNNNGGRDFLIVIYVTMKKKISLEFSVKYDPDEKVTLKY